MYTCVALAKFANVYGRYEWQQKKNRNLRETIKYSARVPGAVACALFVSTRAFISVHVINSHFLLTAILFRTPDNGEHISRVQHTSSLKTCDSHSDFTDFGWKVTTVETH